MDNEIELIKKELLKLNYGINNIKTNLDELDDIIKQEYWIHHLNAVVNLDFNIAADKYQIIYVMTKFILPLEKNNISKYKEDVFKTASKLPTNFAGFIIFKNGTKMDFTIYEIEELIKVLNNKFEKTIQQWYKMKINICWDFTLQYPNPTYLEAKILKNLL